MESEAIDVVRAAQPWWIGVGVLVWVPLAALLSFVGTHVAVSFAMLAMRGLPADAHWTERARRAYPARVVAGGAPMLLGITLGVLAGMLVGPLALVRGGTLGVLVGLAAFAAAFPHASRVERRLGLALSLREHITGMAFVWATLYPHVLIALVGGALMPAERVPAAIVAALLLLVIVGVARGAGLRIAVRLGLARPADRRLEEIVEACSARVGVRAARTWIVRWPMVNALAFPRTGELAFTERAVRELSDDELAGVTAHELGHLGEPRSVVLARSLALLAFFPLVLVRPLLHELDDELLAAVLVALCLVLCTLVVSLVVQRVARRMEERADAIAHAHQHDEGAYARALERIYELNLLPAVTWAKRPVHPHLYDRLTSAGLTPDYPRPAPPPRAAHVLGLVAMMGVLVCACAGAAVALELAVPSEGARPAWVIAAEGGSVRDLRQLAFERWDRDDLEGALEVARALAELDGQHADWPLYGARLAAALDGCEEANAMFLEGRSRVVPGDPLDAELLDDAALELEECELRRALRAAD